MNSPPQLAVGRMNRLQVVKHSAYGLFLDGYGHGEILLPNNQVPTSAQAGDWLDVFIYADSEDRLVATRATPLAMVGEVALLKVSATNSMGAFLDWGLPKDLLVPFAEQSERMRENKSYCVYLYVDRYNDRVVASSKLSKFLPEQSETHKPGQAVDLLICGKSKLGYKCLVDNHFLALLHHGDVFQPLKAGTKLPGYIKHVRHDGRIDLSLATPGVNKQPELELRIVEYLRQAGGQAQIGDKSPPEEIYRLFQSSKKNFKRALSSLYKQEQILIHDGGISLVEHPQD